MSHAEEDASSGASRDLRSELTIVLNLVSVARQRIARSDGRVDVHTLLPELDAACDRIVRIASRSRSVPVRVADER